MHVLHRRNPQLARLVFESHGESESLSETITTYSETLLDLIGESLQILLDSLNVSQVFLVFEGLSNLISGKAIKAASDDRKRRSNSKSRCRISLLIGDNLYKSLFIYWQHPDVFISATFTSLSSPIASIAMGENKKLPIPKPAQTQSNVESHCN